MDITFLLITMCILILYVYIIGLMTYNFNKYKEKINYSNETIIKSFLNTLPYKKIDLFIYTSTLLQSKVEDIIKSHKPGDNNNIKIMLKVSPKIIEDFGDKACPDISVARIFTDSIKILCLYDITKEQMFDCVKSGINWENVLLFLY